MKKKIERCMQVRDKRKMYVIRERKRETKKRMPIRKKNEVKLKRT